MSESPRSLLRRRGLRLRRDLGQSFLTDEGLAGHLVDLAGVADGDLVIEVGTGLGALTRALARRAARVVSVEIDAGLVRALTEEALLPANVDLVHADALQLDWSDLLADPRPPTRVVANLPYSAATPLLRRLLDLREALEDWSVMLQSEVARRCVASTGQADYGSLAVLHALTVDAQIQQDLGPGSFFPRPNVRSSFLRLWPRYTKLLRPDELPWVERVVRACFSKRRKTILNALCGGGFEGRDQRPAMQVALENAQIVPTERAENVEPERFLALARILEPVLGVTRPIS